MRRVYHVLAVACVLCCAAQSLQAQPPFRRKSINTFTAADQKELRDLMMTWIDAGVIAQHGTPGIHCNNEFFFGWHRTYIAQLEAWLMTQNKGTKYVPLPKFNPLLAAIPNAFFNNLVLPGSAVESGYPNLGTQNITTSPGSDFSAFMTPAICAAYPAGTQWRACTGLSFGTAADNFAQAVEGPHGSPHVNIGGSMGSVPTAPAAAIFFLYHAFIDDIYRYYQCQCMGATGKDLYMKDDPLDIAAEPNTTSPGGVIWDSPDIWVRQNADVFIPLTGKYTNEDELTRHENPEYKALGAPNYIYVRIRNNGCQTVNAGEATLRVYWTKASTGTFGWAGDWTNTPPFIPPNGNEITLAPVSIPALQPGEQWVAEVPWVVPDPALYPIDPNHFCLLARIVSAVDPMAVTEGTSVGANTVNNNNVAWKNVMIYDTDPSNIVAPGDDDFDTFVFGLADHASVSAGIRFDFDRNPGMHITLDLGQELFAAWQAAGGEAQGVEQAGGTRVRVLEPGATIRGLALQPGVQYRPAIQAYVRNNPEGGERYVEYDRQYNVVIAQTEVAEDGTEATVGGIVYKIQTKRDKADGPVLIQGADIAVSSCPQTANGSIRLRMTGLASNYKYWWSNGANSDRVSNLAPGEYNVIVRDRSGNVQTKSFTVGSRSTLQIEMESTLSHCSRPDGSVMVAVTGGSGAYSYRWYRDGAAIDVTGPTVQGAIPGEYRVDVTDANGGCTVTGTMQVRNEWNMLEVHTGTTSASGPNEPDGEAQAFALGMAPYRYLWSTGATTDRITGLFPGVYWVEVTDMAGCTERREVTVSFQQNLQGVERGNTVVSNTSIVPNPAVGDAELRYRLQVPSMVRVELYDNTGRRVDLLFSGALSVGEQTLRIETAGLASGKYAVRIVTGDLSSTVPLVVVH